MAIEFSCESCSSVLRVPDDAAGEACECPSCGTVVDIPLPEEVIDAVLVKTEPTKRQLSIPCPKCRKILHCEPSLLGTKGCCRNCKTIFTICESPSLSEGPTEQLVFHCPKCAQLFEGRPEMRGRRGKCHVCGEVFPIELEVLQLADGEDDESSRKTVGSPPMDGSRIQIVCGGCEGIMEVPAGAAGHTTECPFCHAILEIPA